MDIIKAAQDFGLFTAVAWSAAINIVPRTAAAIAILAIGYLAARLAGDRVRAFVTTSRHIDTTLAPVLSAVARYGVLIFVIVAVLNQIGVQTASVLAVLGAAGLAVGLALQGTLSNLAAGVMLLWLRPFKAGDSIETATTAGTVREIGLFATELDTFDGVYRFVPNSTLWNTPVFNYTRNRARLTNIAIGIGYGSDIARARSVLLELAASDRRIAADPSPEVFVDALADSAVVLRYQVWIGTVDFSPTQRWLIEEAKRRLEAAGVEIALPQRVVRMVGAADPQGKAAA